MMVRQLSKLFSIYHVNDYLIPIALFLIALVYRIFSLDTFVTTDELLWINRSPAFWNALFHLDLAGTYMTPTPGVITMIVSGLWLFMASNANLDFPATLTIARLPIAVITALFAIPLYFLIRTIFDEKLAILGVLLIITEPYFVANSRVIHLDALLTVLMVLAVLTIICYVLKVNTRQMLVIIGVLTGLALLTKISAFSLVLYFGLALLVKYFLIDRPGTETNKREKLLSLGKSAIFFSAVMVITFAVMWPAVWADPVQTVASLAMNANSVTTSSQGNVFFNGEVNQDTAPPVFYVATLLLRLSPLTIVLAGLFLVGLALNFRKADRSSNLKWLLLLSFIVLFTIQMAIATKKGDRYILPVYPAIDLLAAAGLYSVVQFLSTRISCPDSGVKLKSRVPVAIFLLACGLVIALNTALILPLHPYYVSYYNPFAFGGPSNVPSMIVVGWGEGMDQAARYLNTKPGAENLTVAAQYSCFEPYFRGNTVGMDSVDRSDYVVFYVCAVQRNWQSDLWAAYKNTTPEKVISINGIDYCWIYPTQKPA